MNPGSLIVVFVVMWWMVFFMALPIGVVREDKPEAGNDKGAPKNPNIAKKMLASTIISALITALYFYMITHHYFDFLNVRGQV